MNKENNIYLYGAGGFAKGVYTALKKNNYHVSGILDHLDRLPFPPFLSVLKPEKILADLREDVTIVLAIHNREANIYKIINSLKSLGFRNFVTPIELCNEMPSEFVNLFWLSPKITIESNKQKITNVRTIFSDLKSQELFDSIVNFRLSGDYSLLPEPDEQHQYFPEDIPAWKSPVRFIDCGAYDGITLRNLAAGGIIFDAVASFEPDPKNFEGLKDTILQLNLPNSSAFPFGVYSHAGQLNFADGNGEASRIVEDGKFVIKCVSIDETLAKFSPNLIKMDIEGAELSALEGAKLTIIKNQPGLAISIYHKPEDLWEIPLFIHNFAQENDLHYQYYLRSHARNSFDTVFYAVPN